MLPLVAVADTVASVTGIPALGERGRPPCPKGCDKAGDIDVIAEARDSVGAPVAKPLVPEDSRTAVGSGREGCANPELATLLTVGSVAGLGKIDDICPKPGTPEAVTVAPWPTMLVTWLIKESAALV